MKKLLLILLTLSTLAYGKKEVTQDITFVGSSTLAPVISSLGEEFKGVESEAEINISGGGSGVGVKSVIEDTSDLGMVSREVSSSERSKIKGYKEYKIGIDALTISVNPSSPILQLSDNITTETLRKIFSGEIDTWNKLNGNLPEKEIVVVTRDLSGGAHKVFQKVVMGKTKVTPNVIQATSMGSLVQKIIDNRYAIGYASFGMVNQNTGKLVPLKVDGVDATKENIVNGSYKISRPLLLVKAGEPTQLQKEFLDLATSERGAEIVEDLGFIPNK